MHINDLPPHPERLLYRRDGILCALLMAACLLLAHPFVEMGFVDDWSYIKTTQIFFQTGHFVYNGWATSALGWQVLWGALFAKLLGFSFVHVRLSTLPITAASVYLFHQILLRFGVSRPYAVFGTLTLALSPVFLAMSASYMTDIPGLFCTLLCLYLCHRALSASNDHAALAWLCLATVTNVAGGTVRQTVWLGVLLMVPSTLWLLRKRRGLFWGGALLWLLGVAGVFACMHWLRQQPYFLPDSMPARGIIAEDLKYSAKQVVQAFLCLLLLVLPVLAMWLPLARSVPRRLFLWTSVISSVLLTGFLLYCGRHNELDSATAPWLTHVMEFMGTGAKGDIPGTRPVTLHYWQRIIVTVLVLGPALIFFLYLFSRLRLRENTSQTRMPSWRQMFYLLVPFTFGYTGALAIRGALDPIFDRYLLPLQAIGIIVLLRYYQDFPAPNAKGQHSQLAISRSVPVISQLALLALAYYAIAGTHDWFALSRARLEAVEEVRRSGTPRTAIQGGFEYDGWTQIEADGYINDSRIQIPLGAFHPVPSFPKLPPACTTWFTASGRTPAITPEYFVVLNPLPCFAPSPFSAVTYHAWMPPFTRQVYVQQRKVSKDGI
jgi:hypothetical protein